jgi:drug/metabolite transporter (DMT)-like permease
MTTVVAALVLASAFAHASWNAMIKGRSGDPLAVTTGLCVAWAVLGVPLMLWVPAPRAEAWPFLGASVVVHVVYTGMLVVAYRKGDLSFVYPIARGLPPLIVVIAAWPIVGERPSLLGFTGVALIALGVVAMSTSRRAPGERLFGRTLLVALAIALSIAAYTTIDGVGVRAAETATGYIVWLSTMQGALFAAGALLIGGPSLRREVWQRRWTGLIAGVLSAGGYGVILWAMMRAPLGIVAALRETSVVFAAIIGTALLGEPLGRRRIIASAIVAAGVLAIRIGG